MNYKIIRLIFMLVATCASHQTTESNSSHDHHESEDKSIENKIHSWSRVLAQVIAQAVEKHYEITNIERSMIETINAFLTSLDPHSSFLDPKSYELMLRTVSGEFFGIGVILENQHSNKEKFILIADIIPDGPADIAGVKPLDKIIEIDGKPVAELSLDETMAMLKGERNSTVTITVLREGLPDTLSIPIKRDEIKDQSSLCIYLPNQKTYYIALTTFSENAVKQTEKLVKTINKTDAQGIIIDLRNNSGGLLTAAIDIAGLFLPKGSTIVTIKGKKSKTLETYTTKREPVLKRSIPLCILVNNYTASSAEILAGALRIHAQKTLKALRSKKNQQSIMTFVVGTQSFGKGSVQEVIPISDNCAAKITTAVYYLPNETSLQGTGVTPDFIIEKQQPLSESTVWFNKHYGREQALRNFIKIEPIAEKASSINKPCIEKHRSWNAKIQSLLANDSQFLYALSIINALGYAQKHCPFAVKTHEQAIEYLSQLFPTGKQVTFQEFEHEDGDEVT